MSSSLPRTCNSACPKLTGAPARVYLYSERGFQPQIWDIFNLGYNPADLYYRPERWDFPADDKKFFLPRGIIIPGDSLSGISYVKIRRPLPNDPLSEYLPPLSRVIASEAKQSPPSKYLSIRGGKSALFGSHLWIGHLNLLLVEGEFDAMLAWQLAHDLCEIATLGGASNRLAFPNLAALSLYPHILAVYDSDTAGDLARLHFSRYPRIRLISPLPTISPTIGVTVKISSTGSP